MTDTMTLLIEAALALPENPNPYTYRMARAKLRAAADAAIKARDAAVPVYQCMALPAQPVALRELVEVCETEFCCDATEGSGVDGAEPDDSKVSFPEDQCAITFGHIRRARAALNATPAQPASVPEDVRDGINGPHNACCYREHCRAMLAAAPQPPAQEKDHE